MSTVSNPIVVNLPDHDCDAALRYAAREARVHQCGIRLVHPSDAGTTRRAAEVLRRAVARVAEVLGPEPEVTGVVVQGQPVDATLRTAGDARAVVVDHRDLLHLIRALSDSGARISVVCVPATWTAPEAALPVTVGVDSPGGCAGLVRAALAVARAHGTTLRVLHAWSFPKPYDDAVLARIGEEWESRARADVDAAMGGRSDVSVALEVRHEPPVAALLAAAARSELLVVGRHGGRLASEPRLGQVARAVVHGSACPVLLLPTTARTAAGAARA